MCRENTIKRVAGQGLTPNRYRSRDMPVGNVRSTEDSRNARLGQGIWQSVTAAGKSESSFARFGTER